MVCAEWSCSVGEAGVGENLFRIMSANVLKIIASSDNFLGGCPLPLLLLLLSLLLDMIRGSFVRVVSCILLVILSESAIQQVHYVEINEKTEECRNAISAIITINEASTSLASSSGITCNET